MTDHASTNFHTYPVGDIRVSVVSDGAIAVPVSEGLILNASAEDVRRALREADLPEERLTTTFAPVIVQTSDRTVLIDAGLGPDFAVAKKVKARASGPKYAG